MKAYLKQYRQSPRKVRLVARGLVGKDVVRARLILNTLPKRAATSLKKLLNSAIANALHNDKREEQELVIKEFRVDDGVTMKRYRPRARGSAHPIRKRTSNISLLLGEKTGNKEVEAPEVKDVSK